MINRIDAIRKRRAAVKDPTYYDSDYLAGTCDILDEYAKLYAAASTDIDYLLAERECVIAQNDALQAECGRLLAEVERLQVSEQALTLRLTASLGAEREGDQEIVRLQAEVERLRAAVDIALNDTTGDIHFVKWSIHQLLKSRADVAWNSPLQQLTNTSQELGFYEEADNPLVKDDDEREDG